MAHKAGDSAAPASGPVSSAAALPSVPDFTSGGAEGNIQNASNAASAANGHAEASKPAKKKRHRGGRKRKNRRQSFAAPSEATEDTATEEGRSNFLGASTAHGSAQTSLYRLNARANRSNTSLESEALLDHRDYTPMKSRRDTIKQGLARVAMPFSHRQGHGRSSDQAHQLPGTSRSRLGPDLENAISEDEDEERAPHDRTPLLSSRNRSRPHPSRAGSGFGYGSRELHKDRRASATSRNSSKRRHEIITTTRNNFDDLHDVNNPPSIPGSPQHGSMDDFFSSNLSDRGRDRDAVVEIDAADELGSGYSSSSPHRRRRRPTVTDLAQRDVCFPVDEDLSDHVEEESRHHPGSVRRRRRQPKIWPDFEILEEWSREEKEERTHQEVLRAKKISEPVMVGGRLRPAKTAWHREEDDSPFRFTYFNDTLEETIHARTISDLQDDMTFTELFLPDPVESSDESNDEDHHHHEGSILERQSLHQRASSDNAVKQVDPQPQNGNIRSASTASKALADSVPGSGRDTPKPAQQTKPKRRELERPTFWLDVLKPTETEMKVLCKAFGIHQLTAEDILMEEPREKVELFPDYYFVNYRSFEQDKDSEDYMDAVNMYIIVFRTGVITFHHSLSPHPANVRRRIRQLSDYMKPSADWISYAIIDDVTDVYGPLVTDTETDVNGIDEDILYMHTTAADNAGLNSKQLKAGQKPNPKPNIAKSSSTNNNPFEKRPKSSRSKSGIVIVGGGGGGDASPQSQGDMGAAKAEGEKTAGESGGDMLRRIGECRKTVMGLYRLLGNKADVIKGFAKRCNEQHKVAPRSEIGLYLGDIQDHIVTMVANLSHYESLLSRAHGNYVAQINIRMNERAEQNADVLGKLTVLGTIVLPMNIITGMWGMNVWVPGQEIEGDLTWFFCITAGLVAFGLICYFIARKVYGIV